VPGVTHPEGHQGKHPTASVMCGAAQLPKGEVDERVAESPGGGPAASGLPASATTAYPSGPTSTSAAPLVTCAVQAQGVCEGGSTTAGEGDMSWPLRLTEEEDDAAEEALRAEMGQGTEAS
jgi:hypothetical protein